MNQKIDEWVNEIYREGQRECRYTMLDLDPFKPYIYAFQSFGENRFVEIDCDGYDKFYAYFQPCFKRKAPLLVHTPGYGGEMCMHPEFATQFNVLHINPLGYTTPSGKDFSKLTMPGNLGTVLPDTVLTGGKGGYFKWFANCVMAVMWAFRQENVIPGRVSFFGTSQGGGASLLLGSIFSGRGAQCVAADQAYLTNFKIAGEHGGIQIGRDLYEHLPQEKIDAALALVDSVNHLHRLKGIPVLLTSGGKDVACPKEAIRDLFDKLEGTKSYTHFDELTHGYNREFLQMAYSWFTMFA